MQTINQNQNKITNLHTSLKITAFFPPFEVVITVITGGFIHALHNRPKKNYEKKKVLYIGVKPKKKKARKYEFKKKVSRRQIFSFLISK